MRLCLVFGLFHLSWSAATFEEASTTIAPIETSTTPISPGKRVTFGDHDIVVVIPSRYDMMAEATSESTSTNSPRVSRWDSSSDEDDFLESLAEFSRMLVTEEVEPLATETTWSDIGPITREIGCAVYEHMSDSISSKKQEIISSAKSTLLRGAASAAVFACKHLLGYEVTAEDKRKVTEILSSPEWIPRCIDVLHKACATTTTTTPSPSSFL